MIIVRFLSPIAMSAALSYTASRRVVVTLEDEVLFELNISALLLTVCASTHRFATYGLVYTASIHHHHLRYSPSPKRCVFPKPCFSG